MTSRDLQLVSRDLDGQAPWLEGRVPAGHVLRAARALDMTAEEVAARLRKLATAFGFEPPPAVPEGLGPVTSRDLQLVSRDLDGQAPWLEGRVPAGHVLRAARALDTTAEEVAARLRELATAFGFEPPPAVPEGLGPVTDRDFRLVSLNVNGQGTRHVPAGHVLRAARALDMTAEEVIVRLRELASAFELDVSLVVSFKWEGVRVVPQDLIALSRNLDGDPPFLNELIPGAHLAGAANVLREPVRVTIDALRPLAGGGFLLSEIEVTASLDFVPTAPDLTVLSRELNRICPWFTGVVPITHIIRAAYDLWEPVGRTVARLDRYVPLGVSPPAVDRGAVNEMFVSRDDAMALGAELALGGSAVPDEVPAEHLRRAAEKLAITVDELRRRLERYVPLGLKLPPVPTA